MEELLDRGTDRLALHTFAPVAEDAPTLAVLWPAMGVPARYYRPFAQSLASHGVAVTVADLRGTGASTPRASAASRYGFAELADDVDAVLEHLKPARAGRRTVLIGHSLGGQMCALHLALRGTSSDVSGLALLAVGLPYWRSYPASRRAQILAMTQVLAAGSAVLRHWPGWAFGGRQARGVIADWAYTARAGRYRPIAGVDVEAALSRVTTPVLAVDVEGDQYTPAATVDRLTSKLTSSEVRREHYTAAEAGTRIDHFTWAKNGAPLAARVAAWTASLP
ncbi:alpha/beta fold hydrolase [Dactylosporangium sucinum]|uniref:Serine aminopeptidase S33 domain-containing protein n=1 Tax=Dactylosporangium sucinum TaxID=1424081 RepID=A0A917X3M6_9ACTN|nr:alpha/beta fold hydrolase [Dactylosporangium sucinum]GGM66427.1 hypothetical protein GCM10007977_080100 [Dactylosporangium sucinum]